jgi:hypothetical protein
MKNDKIKKRRVNISKITHAGGMCLFWYDVDGVNRKIIRGSMTFVTEKRDALIEKYKNDTLIVRK